MEPVNISTGCIRLLCIVALSLLYSKPLTISSIIEMRKSKTKFSFINTTKLFKYSDSDQLILVKTFLGKIVNKNNYNYIYFFFNFAININFRWKNK